MKNETSAISLQPENLFCFSNEFAIQTDWLKIPYGDHVHPTGAIQRLTRDTAETMANNFKTFGARLGRLFGGVPVFIGHPDDPKLANDYPDKKAYGWIMDMEAREDGLYLKPKWSSVGEDLIANAHYKWFSPLWACRDLSSSIENRKSAIVNRIVAPAHLISLGLTNSPNIQGIMPLANEETNKNESQPQADPPVAEKGKMKDKLIKLFALANEATEEQILDAATALKTGHTAAETALTKESTARTTAETTLANEKASATEREAKLTLKIANERKARIGLILDNAVAAGKITAAQRPQWAADLEKDLDGKILELSNSKPALNTESKTRDLGARNSSAVAASDAQIRRDKVLNLVNERIQKTGEVYETAFANIRKEQPALFAEMKQPQKK